MNLLEEFNSEFIKRHDFYSTDLDILVNKWQNKVKLKNIPEAWIIPIDNMLIELDKINMIPDCIEQDFGQLLTLFNFDILDTYTEEQNNTFNTVYLKTLAQIKSIDEDLYLYFDIDPENIKSEYFKN